MKIRKNDRGFEHLFHPTDSRHADTEESQILCQSSCIGDYPDSFDRPGSSFLWVGDHHLNREEIDELVRRLQRWLDTGSFEKKAEPKPNPVLREAVAAYNEDIKSGRIMDAAIQPNGMPATLEAILGELKAIHVVLARETMVSESCLNLLQAACQQKAEAAEPDVCIGTPRRVLEALEQDEEEEFTPASLHDAIGKARGSNEPPTQAVRFA